MIKSSAIKLEDGRIITGPRHHNIIKKCIIELEMVPPIHGEQGFVTDIGVFLNREDAAIHALEIGQIKELKFNSTQLFSEDIWPTNELLPNFD